MIRLRVVATLTGLGAFALCSQVSAFVTPEPAAGGARVTRSSVAALGLLQAAARATRARAWSGTQHVVSLATGRPAVTDLHVEHVPGRGSAVGDPGGTGPALVAADVLDDSLLSVLADTYDLRVVAASPCDGRLARVVEARRPGVSGPAAVAGRFWLDAATGLVLRRDVVGTDGSLLRSSELVGLRVGPAVPVGDVAQADLAQADVTQTAGEVLRPSGERLTAAALTDLAAQGWPVPRALPGGLALFDARLLDDQVLQLSYSDGLSTLSLFGQRGELPPTTTGILRSVGGGNVWESPGEPDRVVWSEHGRVWTLVSEAAPDVVDAVLAVLPHGHSRVAQDGLGPRVWRGLTRVGAWLNPFD